jgi:hypothetical protein
VLLVAHFFCLNTSLSQPLHLPLLPQKNDRDTLTQKQKRIASGINITALSSFFFAQRTTTVSRGKRGGLDGHEKLKDRCRLRTADIERRVYSRNKTNVAGHQSNKHFTEKRVSVRIMILFFLNILGARGETPCSFVVL